MKIQLQQPSQDFFIGEGRPTVDVPGAVPGEAIPAKWLATGDGRKCTLWGMVDGCQWGNMR